MIAWALGILAIPFVFWTLICIEIIGLFYATEEESLGGAFWCVLFGFGLGVVELGSLSAVWYFIIANPLIIIFTFALYLVLGTLWSRVKWGFFVNDKARKVKDMIALYEGDKRMAATHLVSYSFQVDEVVNSNFMSLAPKASENKKRITTWIILWVPSCIWFVINDPIRRAANAIFDKIKTHFQKVSDDAFRID